MIYDLRWKGGEFVSLKEAARHFGVYYAAIGKRLRKGMSLDEAIEDMRKPFFLDPNRPGYVYKIINSANGMIYVGLTVGSIEERLKNHLAQAKKGLSNTPLHAAMRKYGPKKFVIVKLKQCPLEELGDAERYYIKKLNSQDPSRGYNVTPGGTLGPNSAVQNIYRGKSYSSIRALCIDLGYSANRYARVSYFVRSGMSVEEAIEHEAVPGEKRGHKGKSGRGVPVTFKGVTYINLKVACEALDVEYTEAARKRSKGMSLSEVLRPRIKPKRTSK
jgi:predicted GIY-YIG superfamily endonuclease